MNSCHKNDVILLPYHHKMCIILGVMNRDDIKREIAMNGLTIKAFAAKISVAYGTLVNVLSGHSPLTPSLQNHIELALREIGRDKGKSVGMYTAREGMIIYSLEIPAGKVSELCHGIHNARERAAALEQVIHYNLQELIDLGKRCKWTEDEKRILGINDEHLPPLKGRLAHHMKPHPREIERMDYRAEMEELGEDNAGE